MSDIHGKKKALGRGLDALLPSSSDTSEVSLQKEQYSGNFRFVRTELIEANPYQPRTQFTDQELKELAESIQVHGIIQPITIRRIENNRFQLISGERRLRASQIAGLTEIPAFIRTANDEQMLEIALVENIQREDLNALEVALSYQRLMEECNLTQEELSQKIGKDRSTIANYTRLLKLPHEIQVAVRDNLISMGHARALINLNDTQAQLLILSSILERKASVRQVEEMVRTYTTEQKTVAAPKEPVPLPDHFESARLLLLSKLQSGVELKVNNKGKGKIIIEFKSPADFERIISKIES